MTRTTLLLIFLAGGGACATTVPRLASPAPARIASSAPEKLAAEREARREPASAEESRRWTIEEARARQEEQRQGKATTRVGVVDDKKRPRR